MNEILDSIKANHYTTLDNVVFNRDDNSLVLSITAEHLYTRFAKDRFIESIREALPFVESVRIEPKIGTSYADDFAMTWLIEQFWRDGKFPLNAFKIDQIAEDKLICRIDDIALYHKFKRLDRDLSLSANFESTFGKKMNFEIVEPAIEQIDDEAFEHIIQSAIEANMPAPTPEYTEPEEHDDFIIYNKRIDQQLTKLDQFVGNRESIAIAGEVLSANLNTTKNGNKIFTFVLSDHSDAIKCKMFLNNRKKNGRNDVEHILQSVVKGAYVKLLGYKDYDSFEREVVFNVRAINRAAAPPQREDKSDEKRIEFQLHTNMSAMDGIADVKAYIKTAKRWGHSAIAITDSGVVQAFPTAMAEADENIKIIYGVQAYMIDDDMTIIDNVKPYQLSDTFVVFDIETTGFSPRYDGITEIGAIKVKGGAIVDRYSQLVNPEKKIPQKVVELTGINDNMVANKPIIKDVIGDFLDFCGTAPVVAHNAKFDVSFIAEKAKQIGVEFKPSVVDTLKLARILLKDIKRFGLNRIAKHMGVALDNHHRAVDDAMATAKIFNKFLETLENRGIKTLQQLDEYGKSALSFQHFDNYDIVILAANQEGLKELYQLISHSHIETFYKKPLISKALLAEKRQNLLIGSGSLYGELYQGILNNKNEEELLRIARFYDYLEVQPIENNRHLIGRGMVLDDAELKQNNRQIIELAESLGKLCIASGDVRFLDPDDVLYRKILLTGQGKRVDNSEAPLYFRTTDEMLESFSYLGEELARQIVIYNTWALNEKIDFVLPVPKETFAPIIEGSDVELRTMCYQNAKRLYGDPLPEIVQSRLERELDSIISNGYAVMYIIAQKLVAKSMEDGYLVGSRGSVGSSFAATMSNITEVNPLPAHYYCEGCQYAEFNPDEKYKIGIDLPDKRCPNCDKPLVKEGFDIPFETFLGFEGDKEPDIDLNFAGVYQATSHAYTEELFGEGYTFKAGTIGTVADKTAFGFTKKYFEENDIFVSNYEVDRIASGCVGVKRTTGQHPGGIMVVPHYKDIHDFCPIQYPANDAESGVKTTHFDYHSISGKILKLDILGHDVPTIIRMLADQTGLDPMDIQLDDKQTIGIFTSTEPLKILDDDYPIDSGTLGIPEFGTKFVRGMLKDTQPHTIEELVQISGLSHGTDVWLGNAADLIDKNICTLKEVIGTRDNIMLYLIDKGLPKKDSFFITEGVRKGKGLKPEQEAQMRECEVPDWYIESCKKIKYMFPKAHAAAYVMMSLRIAYFKVHYPLAYYATYFSTKVDDFDAQVICQGKAVVREQLDAWSASDNLSNKEEQQYVVMESALEMYARGFAVNKVDLYRSAASDFIVEDGAILAPLRSLQGVGKNAAESIVEARKDGEFISIGDIKQRTSANRAVIDALRHHGALEGLPEDNQLSLDFFL